MQDSYSGKFEGNGNLFFLSTSEFINYIHIFYSIMFVLFYISKSKLSYEFSVNIYLITTSFMTELG